MLYSIYLKLTTRKSIPHKFTKFLPKYNSKFCKSFAHNYTLLILIPCICSDSSDRGHERWCWWVLAATFFTATALGKVVITRPWSKRKSVSSDTAGGKEGSEKLRGSRCSALSEFTQLLHFRSHTFPINVLTFE